MDAEASGTLLKIIHPAGDVVPITKPIAIIGAPGEDISALLGGDAAPAVAAAEATPAAAPAAVEVPVASAAEIRAPGEKVYASPRAKLRAEENGVEIAAVGGTGPDGLIIERDVNAYVTNKPLVTPLAANVAAANGVSLNDIAGTGSNGKITTADLPNGAPAVAAAPVGETAPAAAVPGQLTRGVRKENMSGMRFKELVADILGCRTQDAIPEMNALLQRILPLRPLRDAGFTEADFKTFPQSVEANQQRLMTNAYYPFDLESEEAIYRKCF